RGGTRVGIVDAVPLVGSERAVGCLRAAGEAEVNSTPLGMRADAAVLGAVGRVVMAVAVTERVVVIVRLDRPAEPDAGLGAGQIEEPVTIKAADPDVFDRFGFYRHIGCLRPNDRNYT